MSALQKYKQETKRLTVENQRLGEENRALREECRLLHGIEKETSVIPREITGDFYEEARELTKKIVKLGSAPGAYSFIASILEEALTKTYVLGKKD